MVYPVRSHRCGGNSDSIADIVTTNCEKSAEVIVPKKRFREGPNNSRRQSKCMFFTETPTGGTPETYMRVTRAT